jgi:trehalose/maltose transport system permease protein
MSVFARQQLVEFQEVGYGSAASALIFLVIALLAALYLVASRARLEPEPAR